MSSGLRIGIMDLMNRLIGALDAPFAGAVVFGVHFDGHLVVEALLVAVIVFLLFQKSYQPQKRPLTRKEIDQLCDEWVPEPLHPAITKEMEYEPPVLESAAGPRTIVSGKEVINLASANYLGLIGHGKITEACDAALKKYGVGSCGPRGFYGTIDVHLDCEARISNFLGTQDTILYSYGLATTSSVIPAFCKRGDIIIADEGVHWGIQNGLFLSRSTVKLFKHNDMKALEKILEEIALEDKRVKKVLNRRFIVVEAIYQNSGQMVPLDEIIRFKEKYKFRILVDESNSFGVLGKTGRGLTEHYGIPIQKVDIITAGMGYALATAGGFCTGSAKVVDHQIGAASGVSDWSSNWSQRIGAVEFQISNFPDLTSIAAVTAFIPDWSRDSVTTMFLRFLEQQQFGFGAAMASSQATGSAPKVNKRAEYYPLWAHVQKIARCGGGGSWEWRCTLCKAQYKGSYPRVRSHFLHEAGKGVESCPKTSDPIERRKYEVEQDEADKLKRRHDQLANASIQPLNTEPRIVLEARKRKAAQQEVQPSKNPKGTPSIQESRIAKLVNVQGREEADTRVARALYACGIPFNVVRSPYWQDLVRAINTAPAGYKGPNYEKVRTDLLKKEKELVEDILAPIRASWGSSGVTVVSDGWTDTRRRPLINIIATSPKGAMFLRAEDCSGEVKDAQFIANVLIKAIEQIGPNKVVQVITDNAPVCKAAGLIVESRFEHIFWTPCIVHNLNLILEEIDNKVPWIKELTGQAREIVKFITNHHQSQAIFREYSRLELLKVAETRYASNFIMLRRLVEVKQPLVSMVVSQLWVEWRQADSERGIVVRRLCLDEEWWSKIDFLLKFTTPAFELLRSADTDRPFLGEVYDGMDTMVEKTMEIILLESPQLLYVDAGFVDLVHKIMVDRWNSFNTPLHTLAHALNPRFYDEQLIAQNNGKRRAPHQDREVANGVKKALMRMFPAHLHREVKEEFASFAAGLDDYSDISSLDERSTMSPVRWWICHGANGVHLQTLAIRILSQVASSSSAERNWSTYGFIHSVKRNRLGSQKAEDLVYVHSNLRLASHRGPEYTSGSSKEWDVDPESTDLDISLAALNIEEPRSGIGQSSSSQQSTIGRASCSIFQDEYEDEPEDDDY